MGEGTSVSSSVSGTASAARQSRLRGSWAPRARLAPLTWLPSPSLSILMAALPLASSFLLAWPSKLNLLSLPRITAGAWLGEVEASRSELELSTTASLSDGLDEAGEVDEVGEVPGPPCPPTVGPFTPSSRFSLLAFLTQKRGS